MPLLRIDLPQSIDAETARRIGEAINNAMIEVINVPNGDKFQVITRHPPEGRNVTSEYLGTSYAKKFSGKRTTESSRASVTICLKKPRRPLQKLSSKSTVIDRR